MDRRSFIKILSSASVLSYTRYAHVNAMSLENSPVRKPNILFLWTDQQRFDTLAAYGNLQIRTPNLNALAQQSCVFEKAYVTQPICTASRSSVMTGLWPHQNGCFHNNYPLSEDIPCLPGLLNDDNYRTGHFGKWHLGNEVFAQHGFEEWISIEDRYAKHFAEGRDRTRMSDYNAYLQSQGYKPDDSDGAFSRNFATKLPLEQGKPAFLARQATDFIQRHRDEPFCLYVSFLEPHPPFNGPLNKTHDPESLPVPPSFHHLLDAEDPLRSRLRAADGAREPLVDVAGDFLTLNSERYFHGDDDALQQLLAVYYGLVEQVDRAVGEILQTLDSLGLTEDTILVFTSDHGEMLGSHKMLSKTLMYEEASRVPLLIRYPAGKVNANYLRNPVSHIDVVPTLLDLAGKSSFGNLPGKSLAPLMRGETEDHPPVFIEWNPKVGHSDYPTQQAAAADVELGARWTSTRTIVSPDGRFKLNLSNWDRSELFDLEIDPYEVTNLFYTGRYDKTIALLSEQLKEWQIETGDSIDLNIT